MPSQNPVFANSLVVPIDGTAAAPSVSFGGAGGLGSGNSGTGIYGTFGSIKHTLSGTLALTLDSTGLTLAAGNILAPTGGKLGIGVTLIMTGAGAPVDGTTGLNIAGPGSLYIDITNGVLYINVDLISDPDWVVVGSQS